MLRSSVSRCQELETELRQFRRWLLVVMPPSRQKKLGLSVEIREDGRREAASKIDEFGGFQKVFGRLEELERELDRLKAGISREILKVSIEQARGQLDEAGYQWILKKIGKLSVHRLSPWTQPLGELPLLNVNELKEILRRCGGSEYLV